MKKYERNNKDYQKLITLSMYIINLQIWNEWIIKKINLDNLLLKRFLRKRICLN